MMRGALIGVTVSAVLVLSLMLLLWMNDRRQEMGILVSLGVGKPSLVAQYLAEDEDLGAGGWRAPGHARQGPRLDSDLAMQVSVLGTTDSSLSEEFQSGLYRLVNCVNRTPIVGLE